MLLLVCMRGQRHAFTSVLSDWLRAQTGTDPKHECAKAPHTAAAERVGVSIATAGWCSPALPWMLKVTWPPAAGGSGTSRTLSGTKGTLSTSQAFQVKAWVPRQKQLSSSSRATPLLSMVPDNRQGIDV